MMLIGKSAAGSYYNSTILEGVQSVGDKSKQGRVYCDLADAFYDLRDFKKASHYHDLFLKSIKEGDRASEGIWYGRIGKDNHGLGNYKDALCCHEKQLEIALEIGDKAEEGRAQENLGNTYYSMDDFTSAIERYKEAFCIAEELGGKAEIISQGDMESQGIAYGNLGNIYFSLEDFQKAIECHEKSLNIAKETENSAEVGKASYALGCSFESLGNLDRALNLFRLSLQTFDDIRSRCHLNDEWKINVQHEYKLVIIALWRILLKQNNIGEALLVAERGRAQALVDLMKSTYDIETSHSDCLPDLLSSISSITLFLAIENRKINIWVLKGKDIQLRESEIGERSLGEDHNLTFDSLTRAAYPLREGEVLLLANGSPLKAEVIRRNRTESMKKALRILYDVVISPVGDLLTGDELIIIPDGPLCVVPFAAFIDSHGRYLYESFKMRVIPSLTSLKLILDSSKYHSKTGALLVGNPCLAEIVTQQPWNWNLPGAEEEVKVIGEILRSETLTGKDATKEEVLRRLSSVALVYIAAQGSDKNGEILLTPNPSRKSQEPKVEDYMLTMDDVTAVKLQAQLVVLSCCHSAQGKIKAEGAVGIARGFLAAGARCVLVSLWEINDEVTLKFMKCFYEQLVAGKKASEALNYGMKIVKESQDFDYVKDWAAFQLIGDDVKFNFWRRNESFKKLLARWSVKEMIEMIKLKIK